MSIVTPSKVCSKCGQNLPLSDYYVKDKATGRLYLWCKKCHNRMTVESPNRKANARQWQANRRAEIATSRPKVVIDPPSSQVCTRCGVEKPIDDYYVKRLKADGTVQYFSWCKACHGKRTNGHPNHRKHVLCWQAEHKDAVAAIDKKSKAKNRAKILLTERRWVKANPEKKRRKNLTYKWRRRARINSVGSDFTQAQWDAIKAAQGYRCLACGQVVPLTVDHVVPISKGGRDTASNVQGLCRPCNTRKHARTIDYR